MGAGLSGAGTCGQLGTRLVDEGLVGRAVLRRQGRGCRRRPAQGAVAQVPQQRGVAGAPHFLHSLDGCHEHGAP